NDWLRIARLEARTYLDNPSALRFLSRVPRAEDSLRRSRGEDGRSVPGKGPGADQRAADILEPLRTRIHQARTGQCLSRVDVERLYSTACEETVPSSLLSHIVSCPGCLELVTSRLDLGSYSDRDPRDMLGPDAGSRAAGTATSRAKRPPPLLIREARVL